MYKIDENGNSIHDTAIVYKGCALGSNNIIGPYCIIYPNAIIGNNNKFVSHCSIGASPQHKEFENTHNKKAIIGNTNVFREFCTVHSGALEDTVIGDLNYFMVYVHIPHDAILGNNITIANNCQIGGHTIIEDHANLGLGSIIHQFSYIGTGAMIGMGSVVTKKKRVNPFTVYIGNPINQLKENKYLIDKLKMDPKDVGDHRTRYSKTFLDKFYKG